MIVEIESYLGDVLIFGKIRSPGQLKYRMKAVWRTLAIDRDFVPLFCARYRFEVLPYDPDVEIDYRIDLDTHIVFDYTHN